MQVHGRAPDKDLAASLSEIEGVHAVVAHDANTINAPTTTAREPR